MSKGKGLREQVPLLQPGMLPNCHLAYGCQPCLKYLCIGCTMAMQPAPATEQARRPCKAVLNMHRSLCSFAEYYQHNKQAATRVFCLSQDLKTLDVAKLNPLSPEVISRQATINIGKLMCRGEGSNGNSQQVSCVCCQQLFFLALLVQQADFQ